MKHENNKWAGTFDEFKEFIIDKIYEDCQNEKRTSFKGYDIGFCELAPDNDVKKLHEDAEAWFGIKVLDSPFNDSSNRQFISDYYGGGNFGICNIYLDDIDRDYIAKEVDKMLEMTFGIRVFCKAWNGLKQTCVWEEACPRLEKYYDLH